MIETAGHPRNRRIIISMYILRRANSSLLGRLLFQHKHLEVHSDHPDPDLRLFIFVITFDKERLHTDPVIRASRPYVRSVLSIYT